MAEKVEAFLIAYGAQESANSATEFRNGTLGGLSQDREAQVHAKLRHEKFGEVFRSMASEMLLRSQRKLHHAFQELVRRQADEVVHDKLLGV